MGRLAEIPLSRIRENTEALRNKVDRTSEKWPGFVDSIRRLGILNPISVREIPVDVNDPAKGVVYGLVDGLHRFTGAQEANLDSIPALITSVDDGNLLEAQIIGNLQRIPTKDINFRKALLGILRQNPMMTLRDLGERLGSSEDWVKKQLLLLDLNEKIHKMVDEGTLNLSNAYQLAKLPEGKQEELLGQAISMSPAEFVPLTQSIYNELQKAKKEGRAPKATEFAPVARLQKVPDVKDALAAVTSGAANPVSEAVGSEKDPGLVAKKVLEWVLHLDTKSIAADKAKYDQHQADLKASKEKAKADRETAKAEAAKKALSTLQP